MADSDPSSSELKEFAYIVSHDLGAPVRGMVEFSRLLSQEYAEKIDDEGKLYLSLIMENGQKLHAMMASLLDYSRINTAAKPYAHVNLNDVVTAARKSLEPSMLRSDATLASAELPSISADPNQAQQLFTVLIDNAIKFVAPGTKPVVNILAERETDRHVISFEDNGIGIQAQFTEHIFKPFKRLHGDGEYPGVGMGLSLARKITDRHGAIIWVEPGVPQGSIFKVSFPIQ